MADLQELNEEFDVEAEDDYDESQTDDADTTIEENLQEACEVIDRLMSVIEAVVYVPKGRKIQRLPRDFKDKLEEADEFLEDVEYVREGVEEEE